MRAVAHQRLVMMILQLILMFGSSTTLFAATLVAGPMPGASFHHEVYIWLQTSASAKVVLKYWKEGKPLETQESPVYVTTKDNDFIAKIQLEGLSEHQHYQYQVLIDGQLVEMPIDLKFQTQKIWQRISHADDFTMLVGSCAFINDHPQDNYGGEYEIFDQMASEKANLMLWLGDYIYLRPEDWMSKTGIMRRYQKTRSHPSLKKFTSSTHHFAIWDDHDYGPNDANHAFALKDASLAAFKENWVNYSYGFDQLPGIFGHFSWEDVDFFLLDNRTYRGASSTLLPDQPYLGDEQLKWLLDALMMSRAPFKIIVSGSQVLNPYQRFENYSLHHKEHRALIQGIKQRKIEGVMFLSGDRHHTELIAHQEDPHFYPLYDFTSSPLTSKPSSMSAQEEGVNAMRIPNTFVTGKRNYGKLSFTGLPEDRTLHISTHGVNGEKLWDYTIKAKDLKIPAEFGKKK
jgi:alkaline phosphatase D